MWNLRGSAMGEGSFPEVRLDPEVNMDQGNPKAAAVNHGLNSGESGEYRKLLFEPKVPGRLVGDLGSDVSPANLGPNDDPLLEG